MKSLILDELIIGNQDGAHIRLTAKEIAAHDASGVQRFSLSIAPGGAPELSLCDGNETGRLLASLSGGGWPMLSLRDGNFTLRAEISLDEDYGAPALHLYDRNEKECFVLGTDDDGKVKMLNTDASGKRSVQWETPTR